MEDIRMPQTLERPLKKSAIPTEDTIQTRFDQIQSDPEKMEWETLVFHRPFASRRKRLLQKNALFCALSALALMYVSYQFEFIETITEPLTWILMGLGVLMGYYFSGLTVFSLDRHHYVLSRYGLITEEHTYSPKTATKVAKKIIGVLAVLTIISVLMIGPVALVGAGGLGVTWLVLANVNFEKYGLMRRISSLEDIFFIREHDDFDEKRDYFLLFHRSYIYREGDGEINLVRYGFGSTRIFCPEDKKDEVIDFIEKHFPYGSIPRERSNVFEAEGEIPPSFITKEVRLTSPYEANELDDW